MEFDALLLLSFGGPEGPEQVRPFLENVTRGRNIPPERLDEVAEHYLHFGGVSPINGINRALIDQIRGLTELPVYFGNRNWDPYVEDTVATMRDNGIRQAAVFATSAWGGYSGCAQYQEDIARARAAVGPGAPELVKLRQYFDHPLLIGMFADAIADGGRRPAGRPARGRRGWCSPPIRSRCARRRVVGRTSMSARSATPRRWWRPRRAIPITTRCGSRGRVRHRCPGWNPMCPITSRRWRNAAPGR